ncbi:MAG: lipopolysaccharide kinase InaA family protein [Kiritimatiellales bacterium]
MPKNSGIRRDKMAKMKYSKQKIDGWELRVHPEYTDPKFTALCCCEGKWTHPSFEKVRDSRNTLLFRFKWDGKTFFHKEFKSPTQGRQIRKWFRAFQQIRVAGALRKRGLSCPGVFCAGRKGTRIFCVYEGILAEGTAPAVYRQIVQGSEKRISEEDFLTQFGRFTGTMHLKRVAHGDYQWGNVMVQFTETGLRFVLIDNDRTSIVTGLLYWYRLRNLIQLMNATDYIPATSWKWFWNGYAEGYSRIGRWQPAVERYIQKRVACRRQATAARKGIKL